MLQDGHSVNSSNFHIDNNGWLLPAEHLPSPNYNERPASTEIDLLVVHNISLPPGQFGGGEIQSLFCNTLDCQAHPALADLEGLKVSAHLLIDRAGCVFQFVSLLERAWHAGRSAFEGREECNDFSIGIELEGTDTTPFTDSQYKVLAAVTRCIQSRFSGITAARIVGHSDIAPGRKTDPGEAFDWQHYRRLLVEVEQ